MLVPVVVTSSVKLARDDELILEESSRSTLADADVALLNTYLYIYNLFLVIILIEIIILLQWLKIYYI